jgi:hypothetical protein
VCRDASALAGAVAVIAADQQVPELSRLVTGHPVTARGSAHCGGNPLAGGKFREFPHLRCSRYMTAAFWNALTRPAATCTPGVTE